MQAGSRQSLTPAAPALPCENIGDCVPPLGSLVLPLEEPTGCAEFFLGMIQGWQGGCRGARGSVPTVLAVQSRLALLWPVALGPHGQCRAGAEAGAGASAGLGVSSFVGAADTRE